MKSTTFLYRYETGWQGNDGTLDNAGEYFSKKLDAMNFAARLVKTDHGIASAYVYDRCLDFTRWFDGKRWSRKQPAQEEPE